MKGLYSILSGPSTSLITVLFSTPISEVHQAVHLRSSYRLRHQTLALIYNSVRLPAHPTVPYMLRCKSPIHRTIYSYRLSSGLESHDS